MAAVMESRLENRLQNLEHGLLSRQLRVRLDSEPWNRNPPASNGLTRRPNLHGINVGVAVENPLAHAGWHAVGKTET